MGVIPAFIAPEKALVSENTIRHMVDQPCMLKLYYEFGLKYQIVFTFVFMLNFP